MSIQSITYNIESCERNIRSLNDKMTREFNNEHQKTQRIVQINNSINKYTSASQLSSYNNEINRLQRDISDIQRNKANIQRDIGKETEKLHRYQADLRKEQESENKKFQANLQKQTDTFKNEQSRLNQRLAELSSSSKQRQLTSSDLSPHTDDKLVEYDFFISHASEDKDEIVRPLALMLIEAGHKVWYDEFRLKVGDSLRKSIDKGLSNSRFGIVVLSQAFLSKNWPEYELNSLVTREVDQGGKVILPLWHRVTKSDVIKYSPSLADKIALNTSLSTIEEIAQSLIEVLDS